MSDVARAAGVNRVTASLALNGSYRGTHISEATRQRIIEVARDLGYTPNARALALRRQRTDIIGYYTGSEALNAHHPFTAAILNGLQSGCRTHCKDLLIYSAFDRGSPNQIFAALTSGKIDGLVMLPLDHAEVYAKLARSHLPVVAIANRTPGIPSVVVDDERGARLLAEHLAARGHRRVLYRPDPDAHESPVRRMQAFQAAAASLGLSVTITPRQGVEGKLHPDEIPLLTAPRAERPTAVVSWVDSYAFTFLKECGQLGIRVPEDVAVVGFDGIPPVSPPAYDLTTIRAPWPRVGELAVEKLITLIHGDPVDPETTLDVELCVGTTA